MRTMYILSGLLGAAVLAAGASCTSAPKGTEPPPVSRIDYHQPDSPVQPGNLGKAQTRAFEKGDALRPSGTQRPELEEKTPSQGAHGISEPPDPKRRKAEQAIADTVLMLGVGPVLSSGETDDSLRFIPIAALAQAGFSDAAAALINTLRNNAYFQKSLQLAEEAQRAFNTGDYDGSLRLTREAQEYAQLSNDFVALQMQINEADMGIAKAGQRLEWAESVQARRRYPGDYKQAQLAYEEARTARLTEDWSRTVKAANRVIDALAQVQETGTEAFALEAEPGPKKPEAGPGTQPSRGGSPAQPIQPKPQMPLPKPAAAQQSPANNSRVPGPIVQPSLRDTKPPQTPELSDRKAGATPLPPELAGSPPSRPRPETPSPSAGFSSMRIASSSSRGSTASGLNMENTPSVPELSGLAAVATAVPSVPSLSNTVRADETPYHPPSALPVNSAPSGPGNTLAAQYRVKPWNVSADCFWNIAGKPWVYGDPNKWSFLYYANRFKLPDPQDPHILPVGVLLDIPSLEGETREGIRGEKE